MAEDLKISQLPSVTTSTGEEMIPVAIPGSGGSANSNGKLTLAQVVEKSQDGMVSEETWNAERKQFGFAGALTEEGGFFPNGLWVASDFIPLNPNAPLSVCLNMDNSYHSQIFFYDGNKRFISAIKKPTETKYGINYVAEYTLEANSSEYPVDAVLFRVHARINNALNKYSNGSTHESREGATSDAIAKSKVALFDDMWVKLTGGFTTIDRTTNPAKPYICNGTALSLGEAIVVAKYGNYEMAKGIFDCESWSSRSKMPNLIATLPTVAKRGLEYPAMGWHSTGLKKVQFSTNPADFPFVFNKYTLIFTHAGLEEVADIIIPGSSCKIIGDVSNDMPYATGLHTLWIKGLNHNITINLTALKLECWQYLVTNAANGTTAITVTVYPDVYAKLTDTSNTEWHAVLTAAVAKNISFATNT